MNLTVDYFARLRECSGKTREHLQTDAETALELYEELNERYCFALTPSQIKVAVNDVFAAFETPLNEGDRIVFIPPIAGG